MNNYTIEFKDGKVKHNLPKKLTESDFRYAMGIIAQELICTEEKDFNIILDIDQEGYICGGYTNHES